VNDLSKSSKVKQMLDDVLKAVEEQQALSQSLRELTELNKLNQETLNRKSHIVATTKLSYT
jgi:hypothetical protein